MEMPKGQFKCICFDLDNTLWDTWATLNAANHRWAERFSHLEFSMTKRDEYLKTVREKFPDQSHDFSFMRKRMHELANPPGTPASELDEQWEYWMVCRNTPVFFDGVVSVLARLRRECPEL